MVKGLQPLYWQSVQSSQCNGGSTDRFLALLEGSEKTVLFYYNRYTTYFDDLVEFYKHVGVFENRMDGRKILYENVNCKIYQNYDIHTIVHDVQMNFTE